MVNTGLQEDKELSQSELEEKWWNECPHFSVLLIVAYEVTQLLLSALQRGVKLLHLVHQVGLLRFQTLTIRLHGCDESGGGERDREEHSKLE